MCLLPKIQILPIFKNQGYLPISTDLECPPKFFWYYKESPKRKKKIGL